MVPVVGVYILCLIARNTLLTGVNFAASVMLFLLWSLAMIVSSYAIQTFFTRSQNYQLVTGILYGMVALILFFVVVTYKVISASVDAAKALDPSGNQGSGGRSKSDSSSGNPLLDSGLDFLLLRDALKTTPGLMILTALFPPMGLPWGLVQLALQSYLNNQRAQACDLLRQGQNSSIECEEPTFTELLAFERVGGILLGLVFSVVLFALFLFWRDGTLVRWWRKYVRPQTSVHQVGALYSARLDPMPSWPPAQGEASAFGAAFVPSELRQREAGRAGAGDIEMGRLGVNASPAVLPQHGVVNVAPAAVSASVEPPDVALERLRVCAQFDAHGVPRRDMVDPIALRALNKTYALAEPIVLPAAPLSQIQLAHLSANGIDPAFAGAANPPTIIREKTAIQDVHLGVRAGECFGLLGPNGGQQRDLSRIPAYAEIRARAARYSRCLLISFVLRSCSWEVFHHVRPLWSPDPLLRPSVLPRSVLPGQHVLSRFRSRVTQARIRSTEWGIV
jgi:hypothetical protein